MPRSVKQNEEMREATRNAIIQSAMKLFAQEGYAHTSTRRIAKEAAISTGLIYHYFASKVDLLHAVFDYCMMLINNALEQAYDEAPVDDRLAYLLRAMFSLLGSDASFWSLFYMLRTQPAINRELGDDFLLWTERLRNLFTSELRQLGSYDPELQAFLLYNVVEGTIQQYLLNPQQYPLKRVTEAIIERYAVLP